MKRVLLIVLALIPFISLFAGCGCSANTALKDTKWFLQSYGEDNHLINIIEGTEITAMFNSGQGSVNGSAGCNVYGAQYKVKDDVLSIYDIFSTDSDCPLPEGVMEQEEEFLSILSDARTYEADDTTLTIFGTGGTQLYFTTTTRY